MQIRTEISLGIGALLVLQLLTAFSAIGLLTRSSPAVEQVLKDNVSSEEAVEKMLSALIESDEALFQEGFGAASANVTEPGEQARIDAITRDAQAALAGEAAARLRVVLALREVGDLNRDSIREADGQVKLVSAAGAWSIVLLGIITFVVWALIYRRVRQRLEHPVLEVDLTLRAVRRGDRQRRCALLDGPAETRSIAENLNWLLDRTQTPDLQVVSEPGWDQKLGLHLLEASPYPVLVADAEKGTLLTANRKGVDLWGDRGQEVTTLLSGLRSGVVPEGWQVEVVGDSTLRICTLSREVLLQ